MEPARVRAGEAAAALGRPVGRVQPRKRKQRLRQDSEHGAQQEQRQRRRVERKREASWDEIAAQLPSDTLAAIQLFTRDRNPKQVVLVHQLYTLVSDRTAVDRELHRLRSTGEIRLFSMIGCSAVMLAVDFIALVQREIAEDKNKARVATVRRFLTALPRLSRTKVERAQLLKLTGSACVSADDTIMHLMDCGLVVRDVSLDRTFRFTIPRVGGLLEDIREGRKEILAIIRRTRHKEIMLKKLENKKLKKSRMGVSFHISDMRGLGMLEIVDTSMGELVRAAKPRNS